MGKSEALPVGEHTSETFLVWIDSIYDYQPGPICRETTCVGIFWDFGTSKA